jgi:uncharacterized protein
MFSWHQKKRAENWKSRKVDFAEAIGIFDDPEVIEAIDSRQDYGEERIQALGKIGSVFYLVVYTWARRDSPHHHGVEGRRTWQAKIRRIIRAAGSP